MSQQTFNNGDTLSVIRGAINNNAEDTEGRLTNLETLTTDNDDYRLHKLGEVPLMGTQADVDFALPGMGITEAFIRVAPDNSNGNPTVSFRLDQAALMNLQIQRSTNTTAPNIFNYSGLSQVVNLGILDVATNNLGAIQADISFLKTGTDEAHAFHVTCFTTQTGTGSPSDKIFVYCRRK